MVGWVATTHPDAVNRLCTQARKRARRVQFPASRNRRFQGLLSLKEVRQTCSLLGETDGGLRTVPIHQVRGVGGRCRHFDRDFNPRYDQARGRWLSIARARQQGRALPPVSLVQVEDIYFVKDGHHRISVAQASGQSYIEAYVTIWQVIGSLPWKAQGQPPGPGGRDRVLGPCRAVGGLQRAALCLWKRATTGIQALLNEAGLASASRLFSATCVDGRPRPSAFSWQLRSP